MAVCRCQAWRPTRAACNLAVAGLTFATKVARPRERAQARRANLVNINGGPKRFELLTPRFVVCGRCDELSFNRSSLASSLYRSSGLFSGLRNPFERRYKFVIKKVRIARSGFDVSVIKRPLYEL
jgi:hypothetical protein